MIIQQFLLICEPDVQAGDLKSFFFLKKKIFFFWGACLVVWDRCGGVYGHCGRSELFPGGFRHEKKCAMKF